MGDCKSEMKKTTVQKEPAKKGLFSKLSKSKKIPQKEEIAETFADYITAAEEKLSTLIDMKSNELDSESGREEYNRRALSRLEAMSFHIEKIVDLAGEYGEDC